MSKIIRYFLLFILMIPVVSFSAIEEQIKWVEAEVGHLYSDCQQGVGPYLDRYNKFKSEFEKIVYKLQADQVEIFKDENMLVDVVYYLFPHTKISGSNNTLEMNECYPLEKHLIDSIVAKKLPKVRQDFYTEWHECLQSSFKKRFPALFEMQIACFEKFK